jgi:trehalose 6-phosphate phosphatase
LRKLVFTKADRTSRSRHPESDLRCGHALHPHPEALTFKTMSPPALSDLAAQSSLALFLDVDGTLLEIAPTPDAVVVPDSLKQMLNALSSRLDGALALVSGRSVRTLDQLFAPYRFAAAGIHGCERREANGCILRPDIDAASFAAARDALSQWAAQRPGTLLEDKGYALGLHYRQSPQFEAEALQAVLAVLPTLATHELQRGKFVFELRPAGYPKGQAIDAFMHEAPFRTRRPVFIGDDVTDEAGFAVVNALDGISIRVGQGIRTEARHHLGDVDEVIAWLGSMTGT